MTHSPITCTWEIGLRQAQHAHRGRVSSGAVKAFLVGARNRRRSRARRLAAIDQRMEEFLASPVGAPLSTETANPAMLAWLEAGR